MAVACAVITSSESRGDVPSCPNDFGVVYVSPGASESNLGDNPQTPVRNLMRAVHAAQVLPNPGVCILLEGGKLFQEFPVMRHRELTRYDPYRDRFALIWDQDRPLVVSTYGSRRFAVLRSGQLTKGERVQTALASVRRCPTCPAAGPITIENIHFDRWQIGAIFTYEVRGITIRNNLITRIGTHFFPDETAKIPYKGRLIPLYAAGAIYPKNSYDVKIIDNWISDIHNQREPMVDGAYLYETLHAFYLTRTKRALIQGNLVERASGSPIKVRRGRTTDVVIRDNRFLYTSPNSLDPHVTQSGWIRYSGEAGDCPSKILVENNTLHFPFCWKETYEECARQRAILVSDSRPKQCPSEKAILFRGNSIKRVWSGDPT